MADLLLGGIAINEILVDPNGAINFDTDGNGTAGDTDEFVELVNLSGSSIDISGVQLWDGGVGKWFTFPSGTILQSGAHAMVMTGLQPGGSFPSGAPGDLFFSAGRGSALINNGGDNVVVYAPGSNEYIIARFNGDPMDNPTLGGGGYSGFPSTATQSGPGENFGYDTDGQSLQRAPDGSSTFVSRTPTPGRANVCFVSGTMIDTPTGPRPVEELGVGDLVMTLDHGAQPVTWMHAQTRSEAEIASNPKLAPVVVAIGALGAGMPETELRLSRQHRVMIRSRIARRLLDRREVLVAAWHLLGLPGVRLDNRPGPVTYWHVLLDRHEILIANGSLAESLYLGRETIRSLSAGARVSLLRHLDGRAVRADIEQSAPARPILRGKAATQILGRHRRQQQPLVDADLPGPLALGSSSSRRVQADTRPKASTCVAPTQIFRKSVAESRPSLPSRSS